MTNRTFNVETLEGYINSALRPGQPLACARFSDGPKIAALFAPAAESCVHAQRHCDPPRAALDAFQHSPVTRPPISLPSQAYVHRHGRKPESRQLTYVDVDRITLCGCRSHYGWALQPYQHVGFLLYLDERIDRRCAVIHHAAPMPFIDPQTKLNCPWCGCRLDFVSTSEHEQIYSCPRDGSIALRAGWNFVRVRAKTRMLQPARQSSQTARDMERRSGTIA